MLPSSPQLAQCLQPNRRVDVEVSGIAAKTLEQPAVAKSAKPAPRPIRFYAHAQGDTAFDVGAAVLKTGEGTNEFDRLTEEIAKRSVHVGSIVVVGHTDKLEAERFGPNLSEERAKAVVAYLTSRGLDRSLMFWEGKGANDPLPVTKFCD